MAAINQEAHWTDLEWLDNGIELALKFFTKIAEVVLLIGVGYAGYKLAHRGPSNELLDQVWIVSQILALDLSAPGLFAMARQAQENGQDERASWARRIAITLIVMSILSMVEGAAEYFLPGMPKDLITWASFMMMIARCGAAVGYSVFCRLQKSERSAQLTIHPTSQLQSDGVVMQELREEIERLSAHVQTLQEAHLHTAAQRIEQHAQSLSPCVESQDPKETVQSLARAGVSRRKISERTGIPLSTVQSWLKSVQS